MTLSQALDAVSVFYVPGVVGYYARLNPDPWQVAHDALEGVALLQDEEMRESACAQFVSRCRELVERYKSEGLVKPRYDYRDAFVLGDPDRDRAWRSRRERACYRCEAREKLALEKCGPNPMDVRVVCVEHREQKERSRA